MLGHINKQINTLYKSGMENIQEYSDYISNHIRNTTNEYIDRRKSSNTSLLDAFFFEEEEEIYFKNAKRQIIEYEEKISENNVYTQALPFQPHIPNINESIAPANIRKNQSPYLSKIRFVSPSAIFKNTNNNINNNNTPGKAIEFRSPEIIKFTPLPMKQNDNNKILFSQKDNFDFDGSPIRLTLLKSEVEKGNKIKKDDTNNKNNNNITINDNNDGITQVIDNLYFSNVGFNNNNNSKQESSNLIVNNEVKKKKKIPVASTKLNQDVQDIIQRAEKRKNKSIYYKNKHSTSSNNSSNSQKSGGALAQRVPINVVTDIHSFIPTNKTNKDNYEKKNKVENKELQNIMKQNQKSREIAHKKKLKSKKIKERMKKRELEMKKKREEKGAFKKPNKRKFDRKSSKYEPKKKKRKIDDEKKKKKKKREKSNKEWLTSENVKKQLDSQGLKEVEDVFGGKEILSFNLEECFENSTSKHTFRDRTSSGNWTSHS